MASGASTREHPYFVSATLGDARPVLNSTDNTIDSGSLNETLSRTSSFRYRAARDGDAVATARWALRRPLERGASGRSMGHGVANLRVGEAQRSPARPSFDRGIPNSGRVS